MYGRGHPTPKRFRTLWRRDLKSSLRLVGGQSAPFEVPAASALIATPFCTETVDGAFGGVRYFYFNDDEFEAAVESRSSRASGHVTASHSAGRGPALGGTVYRASTFLRFKSLPYALTLSKTALPTALTQGLPRCTLKVPAQSHWPRWQRSRCSSGMLLTAVDDGVVDLGRFSCVSYLAAWQQPIKPGVQQLSAALWRGRS